MYICYDHKESKHIDSRSKRAWQQIISFLYISLFNYNNTYYNEEF
jgi:hypothetical protein